MEMMVDSVSNIGSDEFYRSSRYNIPLAVMLINSNDKKLFNLIDENVRRTDIVQQLSSDMIVVFLTHTDYNAALLFINKIKKKIDFTYTVSEFKGLESGYVKNLFIENMKTIGHYEDL